LFIAFPVRPVLLNSNAVCKKGEHSKSILDALTATYVKRLFYSDRSEIEILASTVFLLLEF
jgi:hypothetical protein